LVDDPTYEEGAGSFPFDDEGTPTRKKEVISEGIFKTPLVDLYSAQKLGVPPTGNGFSDGVAPRPSFTNLLLVGTGETLSDILKTHSEMFLVTDLMGTHLVNLTSGDFSFGAHGVLVRDGELAEGVMGATVSGNLLEVMERTVEAGGEMFLLGNVGAPPFAVDGLNVAGEGARI
jgi:PmbA protein